MKNLRGSAIIVAFIVVVVSVILIGGFLLYISRESYMAKKMSNSVKALYIAEAGLEIKLNEVKEDNYSNIAITNFPDPSDPARYYFVDVVHSGNSYIITATGMCNGQSRKIQVRTKVFNMWDNAIFSAAAVSGQIAGCMNIRGSVMALGEESYIDVNENSSYDSGVDILIDENANGARNHLSPTDYAIDATGNFYIGNNYDTFGASSGITTEFSDRVADADTLDSELNIKYGLMNLGASVQVGNASCPLISTNAVDGFNPADPTGKLFTDELLSDRSMFSDKIRLPSLNDQYTDSSTGTVYTTAAGGYMSYLYARGLHLNTVTPGSPGYIPEDITPDPAKNFSKTDGVNSFTLNNGNITINGIVYINGNLTFDRYKSNRTVYYSGRGSVALTGNLTLNANLYTLEEGSSAYPQHNIIGFMTPQNIALGISGTGNLEIMGIFFCGGNGRIMKPTKIMGALLARQVTLNQVPDVFHVADLKNNLPPGMICMPSIVVVYGWHEVF